MSGGAGRYLGAGLGLAVAALRRLRAAPVLALPSVAFPLFVLVAFTGGLSRLGDARGFAYAGGYAAFVYVFALLQATAFAGVYTGLGAARDFESGLGRRLMLATPRHTSIVAGYAFLAMARAAAGGALVTGVALLGGMPVGGSALALTALATLALLVGLAATLWSVGVALRYRTSQAGLLAQVPPLVIFFLAPVYFPRRLLDGWLHAVATINPITPILESGRDLVAGAPAPGLEAAWGSALSLVALFAVWAVRSLRRAEAEE